MEEKVRRLREEICSKQDELVRTWVEYVKQQQEVPLHGYNISLYGGFCEPMEKMYYKGDDVVFVDMNGNKDSLLCGWTFETAKDLELAVFGC